MDIFIAFCLFCALVYIKYKSPHESWFISTRQRKIRKRAKQIIASKDQHSAEEINEVIDSIIKHCESLLGPMAERDEILIGNLRKIRDDMVS